MSSSSSTSNTIQSKHHADMECEKANTEGMLIGTVISGGLAALAHTYLKKNCENKTHILDYY